MITCNIKGTLVRYGAAGGFRLTANSYKRRESEALYLVSTDYTNAEQPYAVILLSWWYKEKELWRPKIIRTKS